MLIPIVLVVGLVGVWPSAALAARTRSNDPDHLPVFGPGATYRPDIDASDFTVRIDNPWFPLRPGTTLTYTGTKDGQPGRDLVTVLTRTRVIDGVTTRVVFDRLYLNGMLSERTFDYFAQDEDGNVWYFGEDTVSRDDQGNLTDTEGSFRAGVDGAQPGVVMQARPELGRRFRQEWLKGHAEDQFRAVERGASVPVPYRLFSDALRTEESTALEPGELDNKYYARGIGEVKEVTVKGPREVFELTAVHTA